MYQNLKRYTHIFNLIGCNRVYLNSKAHDESWSLNGWNFSSKRKKKIIWRTVFEIDCTSIVVNIKHSYCSLWVFLFEFKIIEYFYKEGEHHSSDKNRFWNTDFVPSYDNCLNVCECKFGALMYFMIKVRCLWPRIY